MFSRLNYMSFFSQRLIDGIDNEVILVALGSGVAIACLLKTALKWFRSREIVVEDKKGGHISTRPPSGAECSVCLEAFICPVQANCGHYFCARCFLQMFNYSPGVVPSPVRCPLCRRKIDIVHNSSTEEEKNDQNHKDLFLRLQEYNQRFSNEPRTIFQMIRDTPTLLRRLWRDMTHGRLLFIIRNVRFLLLFMAIIFYILSPLDIVPEGVIGMVGLLDDILVVSMLLVLMANVYRSTHIH